MDDTPEVIEPDTITSNYTDDTPEDNEPYIDTILNAIQTSIPPILTPPILTRNTTTTYNNYIHEPNVFTPNNTGYTGYTGYTQNNNETDNFDSIFTDMLLTPPTLTRGETNIYPHDIVYERPTLIRTDTVIQSNGIDYPDGENIDSVCRQILFGEHEPIDDSIDDSINDSIDDSMVDSIDDYIEKYYVTEYNSSPEVNSGGTSLENRSISAINVIDGGSNDKTIEITRQFSNHIDYIFSGPDDGIYDAMNKGIKVATGDVIGILNSDDFYPNSFVVSNVAESFEKHNCDAVYGDLVYVKANNIDKIRRYWKAGEYTTSKIKNGWMLPHPTFFVKKKIYNRHGLYNIDLRSAADYEMILRLLYKHNISVHYIPMILVNMRTGGESNRSFLNRIKANREDSLAWKRNQLNKPMLIRFTKPLQKLRQFFLKPDL